MAHRRSFVRKSIGWPANPILLTAVFSCATSACLPAEAKSLELGQYQIGDPSIQQICLKRDGKWYGTTFHFSGRWVGGPASPTLRAALWGNYRVVDHRKHGYANDSLAFSRARGALRATWYDWFDDFSYQRVLLGESVFFIKKDCDTPFKGDNTQAATR